MGKIFKRYYFILMLLFSCVAFADQVTEKPAKLPSFFKAVQDPINFSATSVFYNQQMERRTLEDFDNRFIIIHFWASWCIECKEELITLDKLQKYFRKKALLVIAISEDFKIPKVLDEYFTKNKIEYLDIYFDKKNKIYQGLGINYLPVTYLMDFNGNIIAHSMPGIPIDWDDPELIKFLDEKSNQHQLLPPEFKKVRDKYEEPKEVEQKNKKPKKEENKKKKSSIFIN